MLLASLQFIVCQYWVLPVHFVPNIINKWINYFIKNLALLQLAGGTLTGFSISWHAKEAPSDLGATSKTQSGVDQRFPLVTGGCHCLEKKNLPGTGWNRKSTSSWLLKPSFSGSGKEVTRPLVPFYIGHGGEPLYLCMFLFNVKYFTSMCISS